MFRKVALVDSNALLDRFVPRHNGGSRVCGMDCRILAAMPEFFV